MISYEEIKNWVEDKENQKKLVVLVCFVLVFFVGFGAGSFTKRSRQQMAKTYTNTTTTTTKKPVEKPVEANAETVETPKILGATKAATAVDCPVKGNIASGGKKIYHPKGGAFYNRVKEEMCFQTTKEAEAAGFVKSSR